MSGTREEQRWNIFGARVFHLHMFPEPLKPVTRGHFRSSCRIVHRIENEWIWRERREGSYSIRAVSKCLIHPKNGIRRAIFPQRGWSLKGKGGSLFMSDHQCHQWLKRKDSFTTRLFIPMDQETERERANSFPVSLSVALEESFHFEGFHGFLGRQRKIVYCRSFQSKGANGYWGRL